MAGINIQLLELTAHTLYKPLPSKQGLLNVSRPRELNSIHQ